MHCRRASSPSPAGYSGRSTRRCVPRLSRYRLYSQFHLTMHPSAIARLDANVGVSWVRGKYKRRGSGGGGGGGERGGLGGRGRTERRVCGGGWGVGEVMELA